MSEMGNERASMPKTVLKRLFGHFRKDGQAEEAGAREIVTRLSDGDPVKRQSAFEEERRRLLGLPGIGEVIDFKAGSLQFVHATATEQTAQTISHMGIKCHRHGLSGVAVELLDNPDQRINSISGRHKANRFVTVVNLPPLPEDIHQQIVRGNKELALDIREDALLARELPENQRQESGGYFIQYDYYLPAKFIKGYFDTYTGKFKKNFDFSPMIGQQDMELIKQKLENLEDSEAYFRFH